MKRIAIIGSGISGVVLGQKLSKKTDVILFEKSGGVGGRMSTRYAYPFSFDHGAQCFTARTIEFQKFLMPYIESGTIAEWKGKVINLEIGKEETERLWIEQHLVATPNMNSLCKIIASGLNVCTRTEVAPLVNKKGALWELHDKDGNSLGYFDWVISTAPPPQTLNLFDPYIKETEPLCFVLMQSCYALMLGFNKTWDKNWIAAKVLDNPIKWISVNSSKPGRDKNFTCLVIHSRVDWASSHIEDDINEVQSSLISQFTRVTGIDTKNADYISTHRWRYSMVDKTEKSGSYIDAEIGLAATSDWCQTSRIEEVWFHANRLANSILSKL
jgi:hypothetical protein